VAVPYLATSPRISAIDEAFALSASTSTARLVVSEAAIESNPIGPVVTAECWSWISQGTSRLEQLVSGPEHATVNNLADASDAREQI